MTDHATKKIFAYHWIKRWATRYSLLASSYLGYGYTVVSQKNFGRGFRRILFIHEQGFTTNYREEQDSSAVGKQLARIFLNTSNAGRKWSEALVKETDHVLGYIKKPPSYFLDLTHYLALHQLICAYIPIFIRVNIVLDYLPAPVLHKAAEQLQQSRVYSDTALIDIEKYLRKIINVLEKRLRLTPNILMNLHYDELFQYFAKRSLPSISKLKRRYALSGMYFTQSSYSELTNKQVDLFRQFFNKKIILGRHGIINGITVYPGKIRGVVRVVTEPRQGVVFKRGDILVTGMTRPEFLPLMKKAGAIVTDAGGMLSHAAIVARELKKPGVIGTQIATKVLKDGDRVEVDAERGVVRKIK